VRVTVQKHAAAVRAMFAAITPRYDLVNTLLSLGLDRLWRRRVVTLSGLRPSGDAVDLCTGTGELARLLAERAGARGTVTGLDFCEDMLARARQKYPQIRFVQGDALEVPLPDACSDATTMACGLRNLESTRRGFQEMKRITRAGGRVLVLELTRPDGLLRIPYYLYLFGVLPLVGGLVSGDFRAYRYLAKSIAEFLPVPDLLDQMREVGFKQVEAEPLCGGIATILKGVS